MTTCCKFLVTREKTCRTLLVIAKLEKIFPRSLNVSLPRATLVAWWKQSPYKQHLFLDYFAMLVMPKKNKIATRLKASRHDLLFSGFAKNFFFGGDPARSCEGRTVPSKPPLPWPTLFQLNFIRTLIFKNIVCEDFFCFVSCRRVLSLAME
jgi:hypothetical protein